MVKIILNRDYLLTETERLAIKVIKAERKEYPFGYKIKCQYMVFKRGNWIPVVRADNTKHKFKISKMHIHRIDKKEVKEINLRLKDIEDYVIKLGRMLKNKL